MKSAPRETASRKEDATPKQISTLGKETETETEAMEAKQMNDSTMLKGPQNDADDDLETGSETSVHDVKASSDQMRPPRRDKAARYAALRNHRIRFEDAIDLNAERVMKLKKKDIIFGRGKGCQNHPGNLRMRTIIDKYKDDYHSLKRQGKRDMVEQVYKEIVKGGARFLKKVDGENEWVKVDVPIALQKVSHTLRCRKTSVEMTETASASASLPPISSPFAQLHAYGLDMTPSLSVDQLSRASLGILQNRSTIAMGGSSLPSMNVNPYVELEAQRLAALQNRVAVSGLPSLPSLMQPMNSSVDYYNMLRRDQLLRERMVVQQIAGQQQQQAATSAMGNNNALLHLHQINGTSFFPPLSQGNIYEQLQLLQRSAQSDQPRPSWNMGPSSGHSPGDQT